MGQGARPAARHERRGGALGHWDVWPRGVPPRSDSSDQSRGAWADGRGRSGTWGRRPEPIVNLAEEFIARSRHYLGVEYRTKLREAVRALPSDALWWRANAQSNSVGHL